MPHIGEFVRGAAEAALALSVCGSAGMGFMVGLGEIIRSKCLSSKLYLFSS